MEWKSLASEESRTYEFPGGESVTIYAPDKLNVSASGGHRVLDSQGISHYIPAGWIHLWWVTNDGAEPFAF